MSSNQNVSKKEFTTTAMVQMEPPVDTNVIKRFNKISLQNKIIIKKGENKNKQELIKENTEFKTTRSPNQNKLGYDNKYENEPEIDPDFKMTPTSTIATSKTTSSDQLKTENNTTKKVGLNEKTEILKCRNEPEIELENKILKSCVEATGNNKTYYAERPKKIFKRNDSAGSRRSRIPGIPGASNETPDTDRAGVGEGQIKASMEKGLMSKKQYEQIRQLKELKISTNTFKSR